MRPRVYLWLRRVALFCAAVFVVVACFCLYCSQTESGRAFCARRVSAMVTANIPGRFEIGKITHLGFRHVEAQEVRFYHPDGRLVLRVPAAEVELELADALHGRLSFERAVAHGGFMLLSVDPDDRLSFEAAVDAPTKPGEPNVPNGGMHYAMRNMRAENFEMRMHFGSFDFRLLDINGIVSVQRIDTPGVQVLLADLRGRLQQEIVGARVSIKKLDGKITGKVKQVADITTTLHVGDGDLMARFGYFDREKDKVTLRVLKKTGVTPTTMTWLLEAIATFSSGIRVEG